MTARMLAGLLALSITTPATAQGAADGHPPDLTELSLEELMDIEITSVSKKPEKLSEAAAAVYVLTGDDIRRSGATTIADALRLVPGMFVGNIDANKWAISARGFTGRYANKLLVLVDGRSVYTPLYSGVYWDVQDMVLDDIERIEVIRGPGGTLWGANAVNGVINIITKSAKDTQGGYVQAGAGTEEKVFGSVRYGGRLGENAWYRVYAKYFDRDGLVDPTGADTYDGWDIRRTGFRIDWDVSDTTTLALHGSLYEGTEHETQRVPISTPPFATLIDDTLDVGGGNLVLRWARASSEDSNMALQLYYDRTERENIVFDETRDTFDIDFQHRSRLSTAHEIIWGLGYRVTADSLPAGLLSSFTPRERTDHLVSAFAQDEIALTPDRLALTIGSKFEHNDYTGFEIQPTARLVWTPGPRHTLWASASRAVRTPSRGEADTSSDIATDPVQGVLIRAMGSDEFESEELLAFEAGYRVQPATWLSLDVAGFYNSYDNLRTADAAMPFSEASPPPPHLVLPIITGNKAEGESYGLELAFDCKAKEWWRLRAGYSALKVDVRLDQGSTDSLAENDARGTPQNVLFVHSMMNLGPRLELNLAARYSDSIPVPQCEVDSYIELNAHLAWRPSEHVELFIVGQNLLHDQHAEYISRLSATQVSEVERSVYAGVTWRF